MNAKMIIKRILPNSFLLGGYHLKKKLGLYFEYLRSYEVGPPNFLVVGGVKCGTFSLYKYLSLHYNIVVSRVKELGYFNREMNYPDHVWYRKQFRVFDKQKMNEIKAVGEFTPSYSFSPCVERIYDFNPAMTHHSRNQM